MRGRESLTAHSKSCSGVPRRFQLFDLMAIKAKHPCSHCHCIHWHFIQFVALMLTAMSTPKRSKSGARQFQESWTADVGFVVMTEQYVHLFKRILRKIKVLKRQFLITKTE